MKRKGFVLFIVFICLFVMAVIIYVITIIPVITGYSAKIMCSGIFVEGRTKKDIERNDLNSFPTFHLARINVNYHDSTVTASFLGLSKTTAIFQHKLGSILLNDRNQATFTNHIANIPSPVIVPGNLGFPYGDLSDTLLPQGIDRNNLDLAIQSAFTDSDGNDLSTRAFLIIHNDRIIAEKYGPGFTKDTRQLGWSMTKSITNALVGILIRQGKLQVNDPAPIPEWKNDDRKEITINNLLQMSSGLSWWKSMISASNSTTMLFSKNDMAAYAISKKLSDKPGKQFNYSDGSANILSFIVRKKIGDSEYYSFPYRELFYKTGMNSAILEPDASGTFTGSSFCYATPRDWGRFGLLYLHDGLWGATRILPEGWVKYSSTAGKARNASRSGKYGALWWVNIGLPSDRIYPNVPEDCFSAQGIFGQFVWVIPSKNLVIVRLARETSHHLDPDRVISQVIRALP